MATLAGRKGDGFTSVPEFYNPESMNIPNLIPRLTGMVVLLMTLQTIRAQETKFFAEDVTAPAGGEVSVNVRANGMADVVGLQFSVSWDTLLLEFRGISNIVLEGTPAGNFNQTQLDSGRIGYLLVDDSLQGFGLQDSVVLFTLDFVSLQPFAAVTALTFSEAPLSCKGMNNENIALDCNRAAGTITLEGTNSVPVFAEDARFQVAPNPFTESLRVTTRLKYSGPARLEILDLSGRLLYERREQVRTGEHIFQLSASDFPATGAYIIRLVTDREQLHRKVVLQSRFR